MKPYLIARLTEKSTWLALIGLATMAGLHIDPEQATLIVNGALAAVGVVFAAMKG